MSPTDKLLREYVRRLINEDEAGDFMSGAVDAMPYGMSYGSGTDLYNIFVKPFVDVGKTAAGKGKELAVRTNTAAQVAVKTVATTLIPALQADYAKLFATEKKKLGALKREYGPVYQANWDAFNNSDVKLLAFMCDPWASSAFLAWYGGKGALQGALAGLDIVSGGALAGVRKALSSTSKRPHVAQGSGHDTEFEGVAPQPVITEAATLKSAVKAAMETPAALKMRRDATAIVQSTLKGVAGLAVAIEGASSIQQLSAVVAPGKGVDAAGADTDPKVLDTLKKSAMAFLTKSLEGQLDVALKAGVPETSSYVKMYRDAIKNMKG